MQLCRTCLSQNDLTPIFPDRNIESFRSEQLYLACGVKIHIDDGLTQLMCGSCLNLVNGALKLRELSSKAEETLKKTWVSVKIEYDYNDTVRTYYLNEVSEHNDHKTIQNDIHEQMTTSNSNLEQSQIKKMDEISKKVPAEKSINIKTECNDSQNEFSVRIEDFESSDDSDFMNHFLTDDLEESIRSNVDKKVRVCIKDIESSGNHTTDSDSVDLEFMKTMEKERKMKWMETKEKQSLAKEERKMMFKQHTDNLLSLALTPFKREGPIKCKLCYKEVKNVPNFRSHAKTHFEPQHACEVCGKRFLLACHMRYHQQRVHGKKKRLPCSQCSYRAVDRMQLRNHIRASHTGERPYICDVCGLSFRMRRNIAQHMRKHFGVRNLQCELCPSMFRSRSELNNHQNKVHYHVYTYLCYLCTETFKKSCSVKKHLVNVHGVPINEQSTIKLLKTRKE